MQSLELFSRIASLEQLHLSAGTQWGWRNDWLIDHEELRHYLLRLPSLKKLALSRDSYDNGISISCERYYVDGWLERDNLTDRNYTRENFEEDHRKRILNEAELYVKKNAVLGVAVRWSDPYGYQTELRDGEEAYHASDVGEG